SARTCAASSMASGCCAWSRRVSPQRQQGGPWADQTGRPASGDEDAREEDFLSVQPEVRLLDAVAAFIVAGCPAVVAVLVQARLAVQPKVRLSEVLTPLTVEVPKTGVASVARPHRPTLGVEPGAAKRLRQRFQESVARWRQGRHPEGGDGEQDDEGGQESSARE